MTSAPWHAGRFQEDSAANACGFPDKQRVTCFAAMEFSFDHEVSHALHCLVSNLSDLRSSLWACSTRNISEDVVEILTETFCAAG
jgi:hypothetical protein